MGGIGNVVMNKVVRMLTRKAGGKAMQSAKTVGGGKKLKAKAGGNKKGKKST
jgi:hypothetical protein